MSVIVTHLVCQISDVRQRTENAKKTQIHFEPFLKVRNPFH